VPSFTYVSTPQAILATGARPVFCDIREADLLMDPRDVERRLTARTRAVMPVHYGGRVCDIGAIRQLIQGRNIRITEDDAHAFGSVSPLGPAGSLGDAGCLSFDPVKNITCGEGGAVATNDEEIAGKIRLRRNLGITRDIWSRQATDRPWFYEVVERGLRTPLPNLNAALGLVQLRRLEEFRAKRLATVREYNRAFRRLPGLMTIEHDVEGVFPFNYTLRIPNRRRDALVEYLRQRGIGTSVHFIPCHLQPLFAAGKPRLPVTEAVWQEVLDLPLYTEMTASDVSDVIGAVTRFATGEGE